MRNRFPFAAAVLWALFGAAASSADTFDDFLWEPDFHHPLSVTATAMSADGSTVVGYAFDTLAKSVLSFAIRWTEETGPHELGRVTGKGYPETEDWDVWGTGSAVDVSADGSVVVGGDGIGLEIWNFEVVGGDKAWRWTEELGAVFLPVENSTAHAVSADGSFIVGGMNEGAFRWSEDDGAELIVAKDGSSGRDISNDGSVVVGSIGSFSNGRAFRWTEETGAEDLGDLPGEGLWSIQISGNGKVIVGSSSRPSGGFMWTEEAGMSELDFIPTAISDDGNFVFGDGFIWDAVGGRRSWAEFLFSRGVPVQPGDNLAVVDISADLRTIVGHHYMVRLSEPVPEPSGGMLLGLGILYFVRCRRARLK